MPRVEFQRGCNDCKKTSGLTYAVEWPNKFELYQANGELQPNATISKLIALWHKTSYQQCETCGSVDFNIFNISIDSKKLQTMDPIDILKKGGSFGYKFDFSECNYYQHSKSGNGVELSSKTERDNNPLYLIVSDPRVLLVIQRNGGFINLINGALKKIIPLKDGSVFKIIGKSSDLGISDDVEFIVEFNKAPLLPMTTTKSMALLSVKGNPYGFEPDITMQYALNNCTYLGQVNFNG